MRGGGALLLVPLLLALTVPAAAAAGPTVTPETTRGAPGTTILVRLEGWAAGSSITVVLCGNDARRGSQDCDLVSGQSVEAKGPLPEFVLLPLALPPMPCPCVVRAYDLTSAVVVTAPFDLTGAPTAPTVGPETVTAPIPVAVTARLAQDRGSFLDRVRRVLGGPSHRRLVIEVRNTGAAPLTGVVVTATVGRHATGGAPLDAPAPLDLAPGERRSITLPVELEAPVHGEYVVAGSVFTGGRSVPFATSVQVRPWGLIVLALLVAMAVAAAGVLAVRRRQDHARRPPGDDGQRPLTGPPTLGEHTLQDPSREPVEP